MNEPLPPTVTPQESLAYQPISGWAIAGCIVGALFALLVAVSAIVGIFQGAPVFFPLWVVGIALFGVVLSLVGQIHVQNSEGTRAGIKLARVGLWLSLLSGLSYFSYYYFTGLALQNQANEFLLEEGEDSGFFARLRAGAHNPAQINAAFLLTLPATSARSGRAEDDFEMRNRHDIPGQDGSPGNLTLFKDSVFARTFFDGLAKDATVTPLSVQDWRFEKRSYKIGRVYRIKTKEVDLEILMTVQSTEAESAGENRKWFVNLPESHPLSKTLTPTGQGVSLLRKSAREKIEQWFQALNQGESFARFKEIDQTRWDRMPGLSGNEGRDGARAAITQAFVGTSPNRLGYPKVVTKQDDIGKWESIDGGTRIYLTVLFNFSGEIAGLPHVVVHSQFALDTTKVVELDQLTPNSPAPAWVINQIEINQLVPAKR